MKKGYYFAIILLVIAALCLSLDTPLTALFLQDTSPFMVITFMSLGGLICGLVSLVIGKKSSARISERKIQRKDIKWLAALCITVVVTDTLLIFGLTMCSASSASLVTNLTIVTAALFALIFLREKISKRLWVAIMLIILGGIAISTGDATTFVSSPGLILVLGFCIFNGIFSCCLKKVSDINPSKVLIIYYSFAVISELILAFVFSESFPEIKTILLLVIMGIVICGVVNYLYLYSVRILGVAKCSAVIGMAPFLASALSLIIFREQPTLAFVVALLLLIPGFYLVIKDKQEKERVDQNLAVDQSVSGEIHDVRNYAVFFGFLVVMVSLLIMVFAYIGELTGITGSGRTFEISLVTIALEMVAGIILIVFRRRSLSGIVILFLGMMNALTLCTDYNHAVIIAVTIAAFIFSGILFFAKPRKTYLYSLLLMMMGIYFLLYSIFGINQGLLCFVSVITVFTVVLAIFSSGLLPRFALTKILTEDESMDFRKSGAMLCYITVAISVFPRIAMYILGTEIVPQTVVAIFSMICGIMVGIVALLLIFVAKTGFTGIICLALSGFLLLSGLTTGMTNYVASIFLIIIGLVCILRKKSYLLLSAVCIVYGIASLATIAIYGENVLPIGKIIMLSVVFLLSVYLSLALFSEKKKFPLF